MGTAPRPLCRSPSSSSSSELSFSGFSLSSASVDVVVLVPRQLSDLVPIMAIMNGNNEGKVESKVDYLYLNEGKVEGKVDYLYLNLYLNMFIIIMVNNKIL